MKYTKNKVIGMTNAILLTVQRAVVIVLAVVLLIKIGGVA